MLDTTEKAFREHAEQEYPKEACGLIVIAKGREKFIPCTNILPNKVPGMRVVSNLDAFEIGQVDYEAAEEMGQIVAVCHSHPDHSATPSQADKVSCEASQLVWHIIQVDGVTGICPDGEIGIVGGCKGDITTFEPEGYIAPLVGRQFAHGLLDCYAIITDWYKQERGITLKQFKRQDGWWDDGKSDLYRQGFPEAGFYSLGQFNKDGSLVQPEVGDVILMQIRSKNDVPNHAGIYIGDGMMLHHLHGRLSSRDYYGGYYQQVTTTILRYRGEQTDG